MTEVVLDFIQCPTAPIAHTRVRGSSGGPVVVTDACFRVLVPGHTTRRSLRVCVCDGSDGPARQAHAWRAGGRACPNIADQKTITRGAAEYVSFHDIVKSTRSSRSSKDMQKKPIHKMFAIHHL